VRRWNELFSKDLEQRGHLLSPQQVRTIREHLGLSIAHFAKIIGSTRQSVYNWEREDRKSPQNRIADLLIRLIRESMTSGKVDVLEFLQGQVRAADADVTIKLTSKISAGRMEWVLQFAPPSQFDQLFQTEEPTVALPALRC
jgi:DNA-binding transcriptional regulator YiaG